MTIDQTTRRSADSSACWYTTSLLFLLSLVATGPLLADPPLRMSFDDQEVVVSEIEPGSAIACLLFSRSARNYAAYNWRQDGIFTDSDGDFAVRVVR